MTNCFVGPTVFRSDRFVRSQDRLRRGKERQETPVHHISHQRREG